MSKLKKSKPITDPRPKLASLAQSASEEDAGASFMNPVKKKRGRPRKDENPAVEGSNDLGTASAPDPMAAIEANKKLVRPMWEVIDRVGQKYAETTDAAMGPQILETLVDTSAACIHQYLPSLLSEHANLIVLSVTFSSWSLKVYMLRQAKLEELRAQFRARQAGQEVKDVASGAH